MQETVVAHGLAFRPLLSEEQIGKRVAELGAAIATRHKGQRPVFLPVLNGAFIFAADLVRASEIDCEVAFIKLKSYYGTQSTGAVSQLIGLEQDLAGRPVILVEDIIDSGRTLWAFLPQLQQLGPASIEIATLLFKPASLQFDLQIDYVGFEIPPRFVIGYGLDYDGLGRNLPGIYELAGEETD